MLKVLSKARKLSFMSGLKNSTCKQVLKTFFFFSINSFITRFECDMKRKKRKSHPFQFSDFVENRFALSLFSHGFWSVVKKGRDSAIQCSEQSVITQKEIKFSRAKMKTEKSDMKMLRVFRSGKWIFKKFKFTLSP